MGYVVRVLVWMTFQGGQSGWCIRVDNGWCASVGGVGGVLKW